MTIVSRYGPQGFLEDLPALQEGRFGHGCGAYNREGGRAQVRTLLRQRGKRLCAYFLFASMEV